MGSDCLFCRIVAGEIPATVVRETPTTLAFRDVDPKAPVHVLVIPKAHYADVATLGQGDPGLAGEVLATAAAVAEDEGLLGDGFRLMFNTGRYGGPEGFHVHAPLLGGAPPRPRPPPGREPSPGGAGRRRPSTAVLPPQCRDDGLLARDDPLDRPLDLPAHGEL